MLRSFVPRVLVVSLLAGGCLSSRTAAPPTPAPSEAAAAPAKGGSEKSGKKYRDVVPVSAERDDGLFTVYRVKEDLLFEIPDSLLGRDMLLISRIAQTPTDLSPYLNAGSAVAEQVVRWERRGDRLLLRKQSFGHVAGDSLPIARSVQVNNFAPIIQAFAIEAVPPDSDAVVIKVTDLFVKDVPALSGLTADQRTRFKVRRLDEQRSFIDVVKSFPLNVNVRHTHTFDAAAPPSDEGTGTLSMQMYQSLVLLPAQPMQPRLADPRVGYFTVDQVDYGLDEQKAATRSYIRRWRLVPKDMAAYARGEPTEPVKPIVYYLDPATPEQWRPYFCKGVEDWRAAFEAAGFKNAIECRMPPTDDPDFDPEDVRYSTVRYVASLTRNAVGPSVSDPRSGEIIESDIIWYHNHIRSYRNRLMIETGAANPQARSLQLPEALIGETMRQVIAHEIGHALGLPHNMIASSAFPVDSLRSPAFTARYGVAPSIMDYARQNYIAQPGDGVTRYVRQIGPYDHYAVDWGYRYYPDATGPEAEKPLLDAMVLRHADDPMYRYAPQRGGLLVDPRAQTEDLGDDPVRAGAYAVANLKRVLPQLAAWTASPGKGYEDLEELYDELLSQWNRYMRHVLSVVGGTNETLKASDQPGPVYTMVPRARQEAAVRFLTDEVLETPTWLQDAPLLRRIEHAGAVDRIRRLQVGLLQDLLDPARLQRLVEQEVFHGADAYPLLGFMADVKRGVWHELGDARPVIDVYRRNLQRGYLEHLERLMTQEPSRQPDSPYLWQTRVDVSQSDIRAFVRGQLGRLRAEAREAATRTRDEATRYHLEDVAARVEALFRQEAE